MTPDRETQRAADRLASHLRFALKAQHGLYGDRYDGDFIVGTVQTWLQKEEEKTGVRLVLTSGGLRRVVRRREDTL